MKRFRVMAAALCAVVLLCGFSVPAYAYADGGEGADYGDELTDYDEPDGYGDEDDDGPPWDEEGDDGEEGDK